ncbi:MAG TPA: zf-HC2 domain-containing protein [Candidatus Binatia bacterium]|nr:zf-HC2 domain-containing protein [Candidatus Binatia bacterium]
MRATACAAPLDPAVLLDYWLGDLAAAEAARVEEHFLGCAACSRRLGELAALGDSVRDLARRGGVRVAVTSAFLGRLVEEGLAVREYRLTPGQSVRCTVEPGDDLLASRLVADFRGASRVDLVACDAEGREASRATDIPVDPSASEIVLLERIDHVRALPAHVLRVRLVAPEADGERVLGEYTFVHTPPR